MSSQILVGTSKGLVVLSSSGSTYHISTVHFTGFPISFTYVDERTNTWWVGISHKHWGEKLHFSSDFGRTWKELPCPTYGDAVYRPGQPALLKKIWLMQHAGIDKPDCLWMGTEPGALFQSTDGGQVFTLNKSLWNHPSRMNDEQWFGTGKDFPFLHTIAVDPRDSNHIYVGVSCAGVFESLDAGEHWTPKNNGLKATYLPNSKSIVGHDPHRLLICPTQPDVIWQQNHCGIFRTENGGDSWKDISGANGLPYYGFAMAIEEKNPDVAWVIPAKADTSRIPANLKLEVYQTKNAGESWTSMSKGLPDQNTFDIVLRHAFVKNENEMIFGSNNGNLYFSNDYGESWEALSHNLAAVHSISFSA